MQNTIYILSVIVLCLLIVILLEKILSDIITFIKEHVEFPKRTISNDDFLAELNEKRNEREQDAEERRNWKPNRGNYFVGDKPWNKS